MHSRMSLSHPARILQEPLRMVILMCLALILSPLTVSAQSSCWQCAVFYYPGNDCWMDSCTTTDGAGESNCSQFGDCLDEETCATYGHGCQGDFPSPPEPHGRSGAVNDCHAGGGLAEASPAALRGFTRLREGFGEYLSLTCKGWVVNAMYSPAEAMRLGQTTRRLTF